MGKEDTNLLHEAAGQTALLKYLCRGCEVEIFTYQPVEMVCINCDEKLIGIDIV